MHYNNKQHELENDLSVVFYRHFDDKNNVYFDKLCSIQKCHLIHPKFLNALLKKCSESENVLDELLFDNPEISCNFEFENFYLLKFKQINNKLKLMSITKLYEHLSDCLFLH